MIPTRSDRSSHRYGRRQLFQSVGAGTAALALSGSAGLVPRAVAVRLDQLAFDFETGNAPIEVIIPRVIPAIFGSVSSGANDATLVLRIITLLTNAWFDAIAPYHPTATGIYSILDHRPEREATNANKNTAILYASYRALQSSLPHHTEEWRDMMLSVGLDPDDDGQALSNAVEIGNRAGDAVVEARVHDGMNQLGDEGGRMYNQRPYADYLGHEPINTAYDLKDPARWQPQIVTDGNGIFRVQQFVTPQLRMTTPYSYNDPAVFEAPPPLESDPDRPGYKAQADEVLAVSAALTDQQKMIAELFDNKILGLGFSALFAAQTHELPLDEFVHYDFLTNMAAFDTAIAIWHEKYRYESVRPFSAIAYLYGDGPVTAWGGPGNGTVDDLPANQWRSYLGTADHPEYPSASASFCSAHAQASRLYFGSDELGWSVPAPKGSSRVEPGITPATDITLGPWETWSELEEACGLSRLWGGVHFISSIRAGQAIGRQIGSLAHEFVQAHLDGLVD